MNMEECCQLLTEERMLISRHISNGLQGLDSFWLVKVYALSFKEISALKVMVSICMLSLLPAELRRRTYMVLNTRNTA